jgi:glucarate dehydratase
MQITEMHVTPIAISDPPLLNAAGLHAPYALRTIVELVSDDHIYGLGEMPGGSEMVSLLESIRNLVLGSNPFQLNALSLAIARRLTGTAQPGETDVAREKQAARAFSAIEIACLDLMGKATGRPVVDLLGGRVRERVPFSAYLFYKHPGAGGALGFGSDPDASGWAAARQAAALDPDGLVAQAKAMCAAFGFQSIKLKGGVFEPAVEVETIRALRRAFGPEIPLRIDPNAVWRLETAVRWGKELEGLIEYYEDPVRGQEDMAALRKAVHVPLATNMCTTSFAELPGSLSLGSEDIILSDHHMWGGLRASVELGRICRTFGRGLSMHSNSHLGISLTAMTHLAAAVPNLTYAVDTHYPWQSEEVIAGGRTQIEDGSLPVPSGPGLGVELDRDALAALHATYLACGLTQRDDELEMQKVEPGWKFQPTRW